MSFPAMAETVENMFPASCIPSPESPLKRTAKSSSVTTPALHAPTVFSSFLLIVSIGLFLFISGKGIALYR